MKGISKILIGAIGALLLGAVIIASGGSTISGIIDDKSAVTYMAAMGMRNAIIELSLSERGTAIYTTPNSEKYTYTINADEITALYGSAPSPSHPIVSIKPYTTQLTSSSPPLGNEFCLVVKLDKDNGCKKVVSVCNPDDVACCVIEDSVCW